MIEFLDSVRGQPYSHITGLRERSGSKLRERSTPSVPAVKDELLELRSPSLQP